MAAPVRSRTSVGVILERHGARLVLWLIDLCVEAAYPGSAPDEVVEQLRMDAEAVRVSGSAPNAARLVDGLREIGYGHVGNRRYDFSPGLSIRMPGSWREWRSPRSSSEDKSWSVNGGKHPPLDHDVSGVGGSTLCRP